MNFFISLTESWLLESTIRCRFLFRFAGTSLGAGAAGSSNEPILVSNTCVMYDLLQCVEPLDFLVLVGIIWALTLLSPYSLNVYRIIQPEPCLWQGGAGPWVFLYVRICAAHLSHVHWDPGFPYHLHQEAPVLYPYLSEICV